MRKKANETDVDVAEVSKPKKSGRKPMTPEQKESLAKARAEEKEKARNLQPEFLLQYQGDEVSLAALADAAKAAFHQEKKRTLVTALKLYVKPEERTAYYVINGEHEGKITF